MAARTRSPSERVGRHAPAEQHRICDETQRGGIDVASARLQKLGEVPIDPLVLLAGRFRDELVANRERGAALEQPRRTAVRGLDLHMPLLRALLTPVEVG